MSIWETLALAIALGTDAFSVAIVCGVQQFTKRCILKISIVIALFHIFMPLLGIYGGKYIECALVNIFKIQRNLDDILSLVGSGLLILLGVYMVIERWLETKEELCNFNLAGWGLVVLAFSVSIDSLSAGISLGFLGNINLVITLIIGFIAGVMMALGLYFGSKIGCLLGKKAQFVGGVALVLLGFHFSDLI